MTYKSLKVVKINDFKIEVPGGYVLLSGFGLLDLQSNELVSMNSRVNGVPCPYILKRKKTMKDIAKMGLIGSPDIYELNCSQRSSIAA